MCDVTTTNVYTAYPQHGSKTLMEVHFVPAFTPEVCPDRGFTRVVHSEIRSSTSLNNHGFNLQHVIVLCNTQYTY